MYDLQYLFSVALCFKANLRYDVISPKVEFFFNVRRSWVMLKCDGATHSQLGSVHMTLQEGDIVEHWRHDV